jgi:hypothetical protein
MPELSPLPLLAHAWEASNPDWTAPVNKLDDDGKAKVEQIVGSR